MYTIYTFDAFKRGDYAVTFKNPKRGAPEVEAFVKVCEENGIYADWIKSPHNWSNGVYPVGNTAYSNHFNLVPNVSSAFCPWIVVATGEQITASRNPDGTVTATFTKDGKVVESTTVKRYYTDPDDLRVATKHALEKMIGEEKPAVYRVGDKIRVTKSAGDIDHNFVATILRADREYRGLPSFEVKNHTQGGVNEVLLGDILGYADAPKPVQPKPAEYKVGDKVKVHWDSRFRNAAASGDVGIVFRLGIGDESYPYDVRFPNGKTDCFSKDANSNKASVATYSDYIIGLVESPAPVTYKQGDLVRVRDDLVVGEDYGMGHNVQTWWPHLDMLRGTIVKLIRYITEARVWKTSSGFYLTPEMFSGIVAPTHPFDKDGKPNYKLGQKVRVRKWYFSQTGPFVGEIVAYSPRKGGMTYQVLEPCGIRLWQYDDDIIGLADETSEQED